MGKTYGVMRRWCALFCWAFLVWVLLTWTRTADQLITGGVVAAMVATACAPVGAVAAPWRLLAPRRLWVVIRLLLHVLTSMVRANLSLTRRIWSPSRPLRPGMVVVPTSMHSDGALTATGLLTSLIVDNQLVDIDPSRRQLQYHAVWIDSADPEVNRSRINGPIEDLLRRLDER